MAENGLFGDILTVSIITNIDPIYKKKNLQNFDHIIGSEKNFDFVEYFTGVEYSIKEKRVFLAFLRLL